MFEEIIVEEIITDASVYTQEVLKALVPLIHTDDQPYFCDIPLEMSEETAMADRNFYLRAPRNTILGRPLQPAIDLPSNKLKVYYPFFSSHFCLPVKPGETVWVVRPLSANDIGYWLSRVSQPLHVEDTNFTHADRRNTPVRQTPIQSISHPDGDEDGKYHNIALKEKDTEADPDPQNDTVIDRIPNFPDGDSFVMRRSDKRAPDGTENHLLINSTKRRFSTVVEPIMATQFLNMQVDHEEELSTRSEDLTAEVVDSQSHYDAIHDFNFENFQIAYEPVPRLTKRPGDLVLQGSNNASITLGTDRGYHPTEEVPADKTNANPSGFAEDPDAATLDADGIPQRSGAIDIVAGRGRIYEGEPDPDDVVPEDNTADNVPIQTRPRIIKNIREEFETDKNPGLDLGSPEESGHLIDVSEGDPDFLYDASRVYISMKSKPDDLLYGDSTDGPTVPYPDVVAPTDAMNVAVPVENVAESATVIVKSDEIRIIARKKEADTPDGVEGAPEINGSIKIIKEGIEDEDQACIIIQPDGTILIDGPKVIIGGGGLAADHGEGVQVAIGRAAEEPVVLGNELNTRLDQMCTNMDNIIELISQLVDDYKAHIHPTGFGPTSPSAEAIAFAPTHETNAQSEMDLIQSDSRDMFYLIKSKIAKTL